MITYKTLYEYDTTDRLRVWYMERDGDKYRTISGLENGVKVESDWKLANPKNVGRANETTGEQQAEFEIDAHYKKRLKMGAAETVEELNNLSTMFDPMLAIKYENVKTLKFPVYSQPKLDGFRCIVKKDGMWSRGRERIISCPHIFEELNYVFKTLPNLVFDGELYNHDLKDDFNKLSSLLRKTVNINPITLAETSELVEYHIYDVDLGDKDPNSGFFERSQALRFFFEDNKQFKKIKFVDTTIVNDQDQLDALYSSYLEDRYEGQMVRIGKIPYENAKRSKSLIKRKNFLDEEFIVLDIIEGKGNWAGKAKSISLQLKNGSSCDSGIRGTEDYLARVLKEKEKYIGNPAKVRFQNYTPDGKLRMPVVVELNRVM